MIYLLLLLMFIGCDKPNTEIPLQTESSIAKDYIKEKCGLLGSEPIQSAWIKIADCIRQKDIKLGERKFYFIGDELRWAYLQNVSLNFIKFQLNQNMPPAMNTEPITHLACTNTECLVSTSSHKWKVRGIQMPESEWWVEMIK